MTEDQVPDFAIFQDSKRRLSAIWTRETGWNKCEEKEYPAILVMANLIRNAPDPNEIMKQVIETIKSLE